MCNLYNLQTTHESMRRMFRRDPPQLELPLDRGNVYPDQDAVVVHLDREGERAFAEMRWGFPPPPQGRAPVTNVRNLKSAYWRPWLKKPYRCLVPFTAFSENDADRKPHWFARSDGAELAAFAGLWRPWTGERLMKVEGKTRRERRPGDWRLYAFLTTEPNGVVRPIHEKAMPVILRSPEECDIWLEADDRDLVMSLVAPLPDAALVETGG